MSDSRNELIKQEPLQNEKVVYFALDADGCLYNKNYYCYLMYIVCKYEAEIRLLSALPPESEEGESFVNKVIKDIQSIKNAFDSDALYDQFITLLETLTRRDIEELRACPNYSELSPYVKMLDEIDFQIMDEVLYLANIPLLKWMYDFITKNNITSIYMSNFSSRQDIFLDRLGRDLNGTRLIFSDTFAFREIVRDAFPDKCEIKSDYFSMVDLHADVEVGTFMRKAEICANFTETSEDSEGDVNMVDEESFDSLVMPSHVYDHTKASLAYALTHQAAVRSEKERPDQKIFIVAVDNMEPIILGSNAPGNAGLISFYSRHPDLFWKNVSFTGLLYDGVCRHEETIQGTGPIDKHYKKTVHHMINISRRQARIENQENYDEMQIDVANHLNIHELKAIRNTYTPTYFKSSIFIPNEHDPYVLPHVNNDDQENRINKNNR